MSEPPEPASVAGPADTLMARLLSDPDDLADRQHEADRLIAASGAAHLVQELAGQARNRPWRLDAVPYVLDGPTFDALAAAVAERVAGFEGLLADLYGPRRVVRDGLVPAEALVASARYRLASVEAPAPRRWLTTYAIDVVALADGSWRVVQDLTDTPTGIGYALLDRAVTARLTREVGGGDVTTDIASISGFPAELRHALSALTDAASPRLVLFSGGVDDAAYVEHSSLARTLGLHLVEPADLVVRRRRLWLRTLGGLEPIDVVYRRVGDDAIDPVEIQASGGSGVPGVLQAVDAGGVVLANAHGAGVVEDSELSEFWPDAVDALTGRRPSIDPLRAGDQLATVPALHDGRSGRATVVVRLHAVAGPDGVTVMAGGNGRVLAPADDPRRPSAHLAKDVWVLGAGRTAPVMVAPHLPQVDLATSVPTRAADALYWLGRSAERVEAIARTVRVITSRGQQDPALVTVDQGRWARRMAAVLRAVVDPDHHDHPGGDGDASGDETSERSPGNDAPWAELQRQLEATAVALGRELDRTVTTAATVGEYLSVTASRVLNRLATSRRAFGHGRAPLDALDDLGEHLAAFAGLWVESIVRGPAWWLGDFGRRLERGRVVLGLIEASTSELTAGGQPDIVDSATLDVLLAANESLVAYRRHHRSDVELPLVVGLLRDDRDNPRSLAACVARLGDHAAAMRWEDGMKAVGRLGDDVSMADLDALAELVHTTWFATPVNPVVVRSELES
ncbi:MAG: circularly permuted type 2 ATP-grasp protein [Desertimonas sp.]